ncbi:MAG: hypothetical protein C0516_14925 [Gemmatimonas sp.]|nr:hypothetical protein [Gemmatimonas sp.]
MRPSVTGGSGHADHFRRENGLAPKRRFSGQLTWWFGPFYTDYLDEVILTSGWKPWPLINFEFNMTRNIGRLPQGNFTPDLYGRRRRVNVSPNLQFNSYAQYDNQSDTFGANTRLRWTFSPLGDLFVVHNLNLRHDIDPETGRPYATSALSDPTRCLDPRCSFASNQLLVKV